MNKKKHISLSVPYLSSKEKKYLSNCIDSNWLSSAGPYVSEFEKKFAQYVGAKYGVACSSGTSALHLSLIALGIGEGDMVIVSSLTFIASVNAIKYVGAEPILVDAEESSWQMDTELVEEFLRKDCYKKENSSFHKKSNKKVAAIIPVHILGHSCDIIKLKDISSKFNIPIIEDAAEAVGVTTENKHLGSFGLVGCFSFNGNKTITSGSGGMVVTNSKKIADKLKFLSEQAKSSGLEYIHSEIGYNYRMSNVHAAIGLAQLENIDKILKNKYKIANKYIEELKSIDGVSWVKQQKNSKSSWWLFTIKLESKKFRVNVKTIMKKLNNKGIETRLLWQPMHISIPHRHSIMMGGKTSVNIYENAISLPSSSGLSNSDQEKVISELKNIIGHK